MISIATIILFWSTALTSLYLSFLSHQKAKNAANKITRLQESFKSRIASGGFISNPSNMSWLMREVFGTKNDGFQDRLQNFFSTSFGASIFFVLIWSSSVLGLLAGIFLSFINSSTSLNIGAIPIAFLIIYVLLVVQSEIIRTLKFISFMVTVDNTKLGINDLKVLIRAEYILRVRRRQFIVIAFILIVYGVLGGYFDLLFVYTMAWVEIAFLRVFGGLVAFFESVSLDLLLMPLVLVAAATSVFIAILFIYGFIKLVSLLIKLDVPADLLPEDLITFEKKPDLPLSCYLWANTSNKTRRGVKK